MISARTTKELFKIIQEYVGQEKSLEFIEKLKDVNGTNRAFKFVLEDIHVQAKKTIEKTISSD